MGRKSIRQSLKNGFEFDWVSKNARKMMHWNSGVGKYIKKALNKRARKEGKP